MFQELIIIIIRAEIQRVISSPWKPIYNSQSLFVQRVLMHLKKLLMCIRKLFCRPCRWDYLHLQDPCQVIKDKHFLEHGGGTNRIWSPKWTIRNKPRHVWRMSHCHPISGWAWSAAWMHGLLGVCRVSKELQLPTDTACEKATELGKVSRRRWQPKCCRDSTRSSVTATSNSLLLSTTGFMDGLLYHWFTKGRFRDSK